MLITHFSPQRRWSEATLAAALQANASFDVVRHGSSSLARRDRPFGPGHLMARGLAAGTMASKTLPVPHIPENDWRVHPMVEPQACLKRPTQPAMRFIP